MSSEYVTDVRDPKVAEARIAWLDAAQRLAIVAAYVADAKRDGDYNAEIHDAMLQAKVDEWRAASKAYFGED